MSYYSSQFLVVLLIRENKEPLENPVPQDRRENQVLLDHRALLENKAHKVPRYVKITGYKHYIAHSFIYLFIHFFILYSFIYLFIYLFIYIRLFIFSLIHSFVFTYFMIDLFIYLHVFFYLFIHPFI